MIDNLLVLMARKKPVLDNATAQALYEVRDHVHSRCNSECPACKANGVSANLKKTGTSTDAK